MIKKNTLYNKTERFIGSIIGDMSSPTIIIFAGIHGNESAGVTASKNVIDKIEKESIKFLGNLFIIYGNINALKKGIRYEKVDLNR
ncbi:MAG: succinylglutamate desuccinylase/aspartoacylase family protein, partial [Bacteroidota bacterium]